MVAVYLLITREMFTSEDVYTVRKGECLSPLCC